MAIVQIFFSIFLDLHMDLNECWFCDFSPGLELCLPACRFSMTMVANFMVLAGQLLMPGLAALCRDWQVLQAVIICPLFLMLSIFPDSLRWLLATQQYSRSKWMLERIAKKNKVNLEEDAEELMTELNASLVNQSRRTCIVKMVGTRNLWKNIVVLCVNSLTGYGIHHCFARSLLEKRVPFINWLRGFHAEYYGMAGVAVASCVALCPAVAVMGRRGGLLTFMIITALASLLQLGHSDDLNDNFSVAFSIIGMFSSHAVSNLSIFFCAEITPTVIRCGGLGLVLASAGFGMLTAPIMELHNQKGYFLHHVIFACCTLICIICILLLPETRNRPLPETLLDGENYTRQPLIPLRKPGEQRLLLVKSESREYARVGDTPLHEAAATAISTMDSTASSAVDLHMLTDTPLQQVPSQMQLLRMKKLISTKEQGEIQLIVEENPNSSTEFKPPASSKDEPLLASIPITSTPVLQATGKLQFLSMQTLSSSHELEKINHPISATAVEQICTSVEEQTSIPKTLTPVQKVNGHVSLSSASSQEQNKLNQFIEECPKTAIPEVLSALSVEEPLLASIPKTIESFQKPNGQALVSTMKELTSTQEQESYRQMKEANKVEFPASSVEDPLLASLSKTVTPPQIENSQVESTIDPLASAEESHGLKPVPVDSAASPVEESLLASVPKTPPQQFNVETLSSTEEQEEILLKSPKTNSIFDQPLSILSSDTDASLIPTPAPPGQQLQSGSFSSDGDCSSPVACEDSLKSSPAELQETSSELPQFVPSDIPPDSPVHL
ncbi:hypothetical protein DNTS_007120, partial [Danionella cerebrum]